MRKVGIMSMQRIANYGSFLQAYALKQLIEEVGCNVEFVDYHVGAPVIAENADSKNKVVRKIEKGLETFRYRAPLAHKLSFIRYKQSFAQKYMPLLRITDEMNYNPTVDCLVIGSDEVFNCIQKNTNVGYSPELFGKDNHAKRLITYAASFGNTTLEKLEKYQKADEVGALLQKFDAVSVRDANSGTIVKQLTGKEPVYNLDPVLTYDYMNCCDKIPQLRADEKYLILYAYAGRISNEEADWIAAYAKKKNLKVYAIGGIQKCADRFVDCSPFEVLAYFRNAEEVITDTFHGSIFSVITHRPFTTLIRKSVGNSYGNEEKLSDLLKRLGLANRMTTKIEDTENINEKAIDYAKVDEQLKAHAESVKYFREENDGKLPSLKSLKKRKEELTKEIAERKKAYAPLREESRRLEIASDNVYSIFRKTDEMKSDLAWKREWEARVREKARQEQARQEQRERQPKRKKRSYDMSL